jgi:hypothetical protein
MASRAQIWTGSSALAALGLTLYLGASLRAGARRSVFAPADASAGHHQIEGACEACHTGPFSGTEELQQACLRCHAAELARARDSHPKSKFSDPRNAQYLEILDARYCVTCHREHQPAATLAMGVTLPADHCYQCHSEIGEERATHRGLPFSGCNATGCHGFHDNRALYEDFLIAHLDEPAQIEGASLPVRPLASAYAKQLRAQQHDAPRSLPGARQAVASWAASAHARAGVNCSDCHGQGGEWRARPGHAACQECHRGEVAGFLAGRHGMRLDAGLEPMRPALARLPMKASAAQRSLGCASCHGAHDFDTRAAAVDGCLECHDDAHSRAYGDSPHAELWRAESRGELAPGRGVSCASCHLPRRLRPDESVGADHNQSGNLHRREEMARVVCNSCHGLRFAFEALADSGLARRNFAGRPARSIESFAWVASRLQEEREKEETAQ